MISTAAGIDSLMLNLTQEIQVHATLEATFAALLEQLGPANDTPDGRPMPMKIERRAQWPPPTYPMAQPMLETESRRSGSARSGRNEL